MKALIITDGTKSIQSIADLISEALSGFEVKICPAENFDGTDLLPACLFFIGCQNSNPDSFLYLENMLTHINLASRKCGIFSVKEKTLEYLRRIIKDCEAISKEYLFNENGDISKSDIENWIKE
jgi:hypothetical protein